MGTGDPQPLRVSVPKSALMGTGDPLSLRVSVPKPNFPSKYRLQRVLQNNLIDSPLLQSSQILLEHKSKKERSKEEKNVGKKEKEKNYKGKTKNIKN
jgi:hypothetical protein